MSKDRNQNIKRGLTTLPVIVASAFVAINFGWLAVAIGWGILALVIVLLSIEPFTSAILALAALIAGAYFISPLTAVGAALIIASALLTAFIILAWRSIANGRQIRRQLRKK